MFRRLPETGAAKGRAVIRFSFDDHVVEARQGETVAAALLAAGIDRFRDTAVSGAPRAPYCMMGVCFDCLVEIDGRANRRACQETVRAGMQVRRQRGAREVV